MEGGPTDPKITEMLSKLSEASGNVPEGVENEPAEPQQAVEAEDRAEFSNLPDLPTLQNIYNWDRRSLAAETVKALDAKVPINLTTTQAMISRFVEDQSRFYGSEDDPEAVAWPEGAIEESKTAGNHKDTPDLPSLDDNSEDLNSWLDGLLDPIVKPGESPTFPDGIDDIDDANAIETVMYEMMRRLSDADKPEALHWLLDNLSRADQFDGIVSMNIITLIKQEPESKALYSTLLSFIAAELKKPPEGLKLDHDSDVGYQPLTKLGDMRLEHDPNERDFGDPSYDLLWDLSLFDFNQQPFLRALVDQPDEDMRRIVAEYTIHKGSYAAVLNAVREGLQDSVGDDRNKIEGLGKILIGFEPDDERDFHACLDFVYQHADFSDYEGYSSTHETDKKVLNGEVGHAQDGVVLDIGSGEGRLAIEVAQETGKQVLGIDISEGEVAKAQIAAEAAQADDRVDFQVGNMHSLGVEPNSIAFAYTLGRTLTHDEIYSDMNASSFAVWRALEPGGTWVFDLPHPNKGNILKLRERSAAVCESIGLKVNRSANPDNQGSDMPDIDVIIDSPDGKQFYNRRVPQFDQVQDMLSRLGFEVEIIEEAPLEGPSYNSDDRNVYFRARKPTDAPDRSERLSKLDARLLALSES